MIPSSNLIEGCVIAWSDGSKISFLSTLVELCVQEESFLVLEIAELSRAFSHSAIVSSHILVNRAITASTARIECFE